MKATGIVRRIDDLGRVVIPKEIRRTMRIREGDPLEIFTDNDGEVIFKKYSPIGELSSFAGQYGEVLFKTGGYPVIICDRDHVISVAGVSKKELIERPEQVQDFSPPPATASTTMFYTGIDPWTMEKVFVPTDPTEKKLQPVEGVDHYSLVQYPIIASGDVCGSVMYLMNKPGDTAGDSEQKLIAAAAAFLGRQMEE